MVKDKMMQQANWEKKREKLDRKRESERGAARKSEKEDKKRQKEDLHKEHKEATFRRVVPTSVYIIRALASTFVIGLYLAALLQIVNHRDATIAEDSVNSSTSDMTGTGKSEREPSLWATPVLPAVLTAVLVVALTCIARLGTHWYEHIAKEEAANQIKGQLEQKSVEKERAHRDNERRLLLLKEARERDRRRSAEEDAAFQQARELARTLRRQREARQAEEARARSQAGATGDEGERDAYGWTSRQQSQLREAVARYPESWSHARKKRWEMIASEVDGHDARACEAAFVRLEQAREAAADAKAESRKDVKKTEVDAASLENDLDWLGDADNTTVPGGFDSGDDEGEDEDEEEEQGRDSERMAVEVEPEHKGTEIRLEGIKAMQGCATVQVELLHLQLACADCRASTQLYLSGADEDAADAKTWCEGCSGLIAVRLRPTLLHRANTKLCYVDCVRCAVTDVLPSVLMSVCETCDSANVHKHEFVRNRTLSGTCFSCHSKYAFGAEAIRIEVVTPCDSGHSGRAAGQRRQAASAGDDGDPMDEIAEELRWLRKKAKSDPRQQLIKLGSPLPQMGACSHFKKSYKWYRFACCGRAFPCPTCHVESACPAAGLGAHASRMICGKCSMEQSYSPARACEKCGFAMQAKGSTHWDDGAGTRNLAAMSTKDSKKFKGGLRQVTSKTKTSSSKSDRVGAKAKAKREHARRFGREG